MLKMPGVAGDPIAWATAAADYNMGVGSVLHHLDQGDQLYVKGTINGPTLSTRTHLQIFHLYNDV